MDPFDCINYEKNMHHKQSLMLVKKAFEKVKYAAYVWRQVNFMYHKIPNPKAVPKFIGVITHMTRSLSFTIEFYGRSIEFDATSICNFFPKKESLTST